MGKTYSVEKKTEEVIIAQNGANSATNSHFEQTIEKYGIVIMLIAAVLSIYILYMVYKRCKQGTQKMLRKEMAVWHSTTSLPMAQQAQPRHNMV